MDQEILARARQALEARQLAGALLSEPSSVAWVSGGYAPVPLAGPSPFEGGPALLWLDRERVVLLVSDAEQSAAAATGAETIAYVGYQAEGPLEPLKAQAEAVRAFLHSAGVKGPIGVESLPQHIWKEAASVWPDQHLIVIDGWTTSLRMVKTSDEIVKIQAACDLCSTAQAVLRRLQLNGDIEGKTEVAAFNVLLSAMEQQAGQRLPVLADFVAGQRTSQVGGPPTSYVIQRGDPVLADIVPRLNGYWGDICNVRFAGEPSAELKQYYTAAHEALMATINAVRPGVRANALDRMARDVLAKHGYPQYPHHTGHGLGTAYHEEPRLCAYNPTPLQAGMVIAIEPGVYVEGVGGVRCEHVLLVTDNGSKILTDHTFEL